MFLPFQGEMMGRRSPEIDRPNMRIVLLGKNETENSRVGNAILGRAAFDPETPPANVEGHSERVREKLEERHITVINAPHLLSLNLSQHQITQEVKDCLSLSAPGPHVIILVLQHNDFSDGDRYRVKYVLKQFSELALKNTIVLTTEQHVEQNIVMKNNPIHQLIKECEGGHLQLVYEAQGWHSQIIQRIEMIIKQNQEEFLICDIYEQAYEGTSVDEEPSSSGVSVRTEKEKLEDSDYNKPNKSLIKINIGGGVMHYCRREKPKSNLVLCGRDGSLKNSISKLLRGKNITHSASLKENSKVCVKKEGEAYGRQITVVELPALSSSDLSEEEVIRETFSCVSLCDPGVHAFLFIYPVGPYTDEDKAEVKKVQRIFNCTDHTMLLLTARTVGKPVINYVKYDTESQRLISLSGGRYNVLGLKEHGNSQQISDLLSYIEHMMSKPYSLHMYIRAQEQRVRHELEETYKDKLQKMEKTIKELQEKVLLESDEDESDSLKCLRIVLIGKTGNGKSATGNTILGRIEFLSKANTDSLTKVCQKGFGEVDGKSVAVVDTPGLFDTTLTNEQVQEEIIKCISLSSPGPHVFITVLSIGRFTKEEMDTLDLIKKIFGPKAAQFSIVLFTRGDDLEDETIEDYVKRSDNAQLNKLLRDCGNRFLAFNNRELNNRRQVTHLLNMMEMMIKSNAEQYFTNKMFEDAEMSIKKRVEEILKEKEREIQAEKDELKFKYDKEMEELKKTLEEEKIKIDEERMQMESRFKDKLESHIKKFKKKEETERKKRETEDQIRSGKEEQLKNEYYIKIQEMKCEIENQRKQYEKQQKEKEEEDKKREEKYKQDQEKLKNEQECIIEELKKNQEEEMKQRDLKETQREIEEEKERQRWEKIIKEAENDKNEIQEEIKQKQREWEKKNKRQIRHREEEKRKTEKRHEEQLREKQEELERLRKKSEEDREKERQKREEERQQQNTESEQKEQEYEKRKNEMKKHYEQLERERKEEWKNKKQHYDKMMEEERKIWEKRIEDLKQEREEEIRKREDREKTIKEKEERDRDEMIKKYEQKIKEVKRKHEDDARKQAENFNEFKDRKEQHIQELMNMLKESQKQYENLEDLHKYLQDEQSEEVKKLKEEIEKLKKKWCRLM